MLQNELCISHTDVINENVGISIIQSTMLNSSPSEYNFFVRINRGDELRIPFNIGCQWNLSREIVQIKCSDELSVRQIKRSRLY